MIQGKKVLLRPVEEADLGLMVEMINDPEIAHLVGGFSFPISMAEQREWFKRSMADKGTQRWIVQTLEGEAIGLTGLWQIDWHNRHAMTALKLAGPNIRGKGYGTDAIFALMSYAFYQVGLNRLWGEILPFNVGSYKAYVEKCGWKVEGVYRQHVFRDGAFQDQLRVGILKSDFDEVPDARPYIPARNDASVTIQPQHAALGLVGAGKSK